MSKPETLTTRSYHMSMGAGLDGLILRQHAVPQPGPGEVLVRVRAVSLNYRELLILRDGRYPLPVQPDVVAVSDGAGEVIAVGPGVTEVVPGDRVMASIFPDWHDGPFSMVCAAQLGGSLNGMLTEYTVLPATALVSIPPHLSFEEAATLPCAAVTAWNALHGGRSLHTGDNTVLVLGSGGVSLFALQLAHAAGLRVLATTSTEDKARRLRALGADEVINYTSTPEWAAAVRARTGGRGVQRVVETGGNTLAQSLVAVGMGGEVALVGSVGGPMGMIDAAALFAAGATLRPLAVGSRAQFAQMTQVIAAHRIKPVIDRVFDFDEAPAAFAWYATGRSFGKVVIRIGAD